MTMKEKMVMEKTDAAWDVLETQGCTAPCGSLRINGGCKRTGIVVGIDSFCY